MSDDQGSNSSGDIELIDTDFEASLQLQRWTQASTNAAPRQSGEHPVWRTFVCLTLRAKCPNLQTPTTWCSGKWRQDKDGRIYQEQHGLGNKDIGHDSDTITGWTGEVRLVGFLFLFVFVPSFFLSLCVSVSEWVSVSVCLWGVRGAYPFPHPLSPSKFALKKGAKYKRMVQGKSGKTYWWL